MKIKSPKLGCIVVLKRGTNPWEGHVGFFSGEDDSHIQLLDGNQGNAVSVAPQRKENLLGCLWPK